MTADDSYGEDVVDNQGAHDQTPTQVPDAPAEDAQEQAAPEADREVGIDLGGDYASAESTDSGINLDFDTEPGAPSGEGDINLDFTTAEDEARAEAEAKAEAEAEAEGTDIADKAVEQLREELHSKFGDWYVVHTYSGMENRVKQNLENRATSLNMEDFIFEVRVPTEEVDELRNGQKKRIKRTVLPGYVLVRMDLTDESWSTVRHTPSVTGFVGHSNQPIPLSLEEVEKMLAPGVIAAAQAEAGAAGAPRRAKRKVEVADFGVGDSVMVVEGPFAGVHATITEINESSQRLKALVEILGRETPVDLTFAQIQKV